MTQNPPLPFADTRNFEDVKRGFVARLEPNVVRDAAGKVVWDNDSFGFLSADAPDTANPSLWRQSQLVAVDGLFEVTDGILSARA